MNRLGYAGISGYFLTKRNQTDCINSREGSMKVRYCEGAKVRGDRRAKTNKDQGSNSERGCHRKVRDYLSLKITYQKSFVESNSPKF